MRNFKCHADTDIALGDCVVLHGPADSGKTSIMQALTQWSIGAKRWHDRHGDRLVAASRSGVTIARQDLVFVPAPHAKMLWRHLATRSRGRADTTRVRIEVSVEGVTDHRLWRCSLEFDYGNSEVLYCRPATVPGDDRRRTPVPSDAALVDVVYIPPLCGVIANEVRLSEGAVNVRLGEGRTAELLRNVCHRVLVGDPKMWEDIAATVEAVFGVRLHEPRYDPSRGEVGLGYQCGRSSLDISCAGQGLRQALFLVASAAAHPGAVLLLDAPDTHLDLARWIDTYGAVRALATQTGSQIITAGRSDALVGAAEYYGDTVVTLEAPTTAQAGRFYPAPRAAVHKS